MILFCWYTLAFPWGVSCRAVWPAPLGHHEAYLEQHGCTQATKIYTQYLKQCFCSLKPLKFITGALIVTITTSTIMGHVFGISGYAHECHQPLQSYQLRYAICSRERQQWYGKKVTMEQMNCTTLTIVLLAIPDDRPVAIIAAITWQWI
jgi:hypothetical protein